MTSSIKVVLRKKANKQGLFPIAIRITKDRKSSYTLIGQYIDEKFWDSKNQKVRKSHPNSGRLNLFIVSKLAETTDKSLELESNSKVVTAFAVKKQLQKQKTSRTFFTLAGEYIQQLEKEGKYNRVSTDKPHIKHFKEFLKGSDIVLQDITDLMLRNYLAALRGKQDKSERTIINHLIVIRTILNQGMREGILDRKYYPFGKGKIQIKFPESAKIGLSIEEVSLLENKVSELSLPQQNAVNVWLFSLYFAGMRISDVLRLKWSDFQNDRLHYTMGKNNKYGSLKIPQKAKLILEQYEQYKNGDNDTVFHELKSIDQSDKAYTQKLIKNAVKKFNTHLKKIAKQLGLPTITMHISRHSFAQISRDSIPIQVLQKLYRHTSITTTIGYQSNFINQEADDALDKVIGF